MTSPLSDRLNDISSSSGRPRGLRRQAQRARRRDQARSERQRQMGVQQLEPRLAMAVDFFAVKGSGALTDSWVTIIASDGDDAYAQQIATTKASLLIADNASFLSPKEILDIESYDDVFVTNAQRVPSNDIRIATFETSSFQYRAQVSDDYPLADLAARQTFFVLPHADIDNQIGDGAVQGRFTNGVGGVWEFQAGDGLNGIFPFSDSTVFSTSKPNPLTDADSYIIDFKAFSGLGASTGPQPISAVIARTGLDAQVDGYDAVLKVVWDSALIDAANPSAFSPASPPVLESITYDRESTAGDFRETYTNIFASSSASPSFRLPEGASPGEIVQGTLSGIIDIVQHGARFEFTTQTRTIPEESTDSRQPLVFRGLDANGIPVGTWVSIAEFETYGDSGAQPRDVQGYVDPVSGIVQLVFTNGFDFDPGQGGAQEVGPVTMTAEFARYSQPSEASDFTLFPGQDFTRSLTVDLLAPGSTISIESPIIEAEFLDLRGGNVFFQAPVSTTAELRIGPSQLGIPVDDEETPTEDFTCLAADVNLVLEGDFASQIRVGRGIRIRTAGDPLAGIDGADYDRRVMSVRSIAVPGQPVQTLIKISSPLDTNSTSGLIFFADEVVAERVFFNASVAATNFDIRLADDPNTSAVTRSLMFVSTTGSLAGELPTTSDPSDSPFDTLFVQVNTGDIIVEGNILGQAQSYILQSPEEGDRGENHRGPYSFTTVSPISGGDTGLIAGGVVAVTLGNDLPTYYDEVENGGSSAFNVVSLRTDIDRMRIQASDRKGDPLQIPFPYELNVAEVKDKIIFDAVAASSLPITLSAVDDIDFRATLLSAADISMEAGGDLLMNAPLSTMFGEIRLTGATLTVSNSVRVLDVYSDEFVSDIVLNATNGSMKLVGPVTAVNKVELIQAGSTGKIFGDARVIADSLSFVADGSIALRTAVRKAEGTSNGSVSLNDLDDLEAAIVANGAVTLRANGPDVERPGAGSAALLASVEGVTSLFVSAPKGSIDIYNPSAQSFTLGNKAQLLAGTAASMAASGSVKIRSEGGAISVLDAPVAGLDAQAVRLASTDDLTGTYSRRQPGTFPGILTASSDGPLLIDGTTPRVRDFVLLTGQASPLQNGIYQVLQVGSPTSAWRLGRVAQFDTTREMSANTLFRVTDGAANVGKVFQLTSYDTSTALGATPVAVRTISNRSDDAAKEGDWVAVRAASSLVLDAEYDDATHKLTSVAQVVLPAAAFNGVTLEPDDLVLVRTGIRSGSTINHAANGVYRVISVGGGSSNWELERLSLADFDISAGAVAVVDEGSLRSRLTGEAFFLQFDSLGYDPMTIEDATAVVQTEIGSNDFNDSITFVISTTGGRNNSAGSLGKMLLLSQQNIAVDPLDPSQPQKADLQFANTVAGTIQLVQQLPQITKPLVVDASQPRFPLGVSGASTRIVIDGSRITQLRNGSLATSLSEVHGIEVVGPDASGAVVGGLGMVGFTRGAAVRLQGTDPGSPLAGVVVDRMVLGVNIAGARSPNKLGILVDGNVGGFTTLSGNTVLSSTEAGIRLAATSSEDSVRIVNSTIGRERFENKIGIDVDSGVNRIGLTPPVGAPLRVSATFVDDTTFSVPLNFAVARLVNGMGVFGARIVPDDGTPVAMIESVTRDLAANLYLVTIKDGTIAAGPSSFQLDFGSFADFVEGSDVVEVPVGISIDELFIGQNILSVNLPVGTTIRQIDRASSLLALSREAIRSGMASVVIDAPLRNAVSFNIRGIQLDGGSNTVMATDVTNAVFSGISINGVAAGGTQRIGSPGQVSIDGRVSEKDRVAATSNVIRSNGQYGVFVSNTVNEAAVFIRGNYLGVTPANVPLANRAGNVFFEGLASGNPLVNPAATFARTGPLLNPISGVNEYTFTVSSTAHGLNVGDKVYITSSTAGSGSGPTAVAVTVTTVASKDSFAFTLPTTAAGTAALGSFRISKYGLSLAALKLTNNVDFEGNLHAAFTGRSTTAPGTSTQGITPTGRPRGTPPRLR